MRKLSWLHFVRRHALPHMLPAIEGSYMAAVSAAVQRSSRQVPLRRGLNYGAACYVAGQFLNHQLPMMASLRLMLPELGQGLGSIARQSLLQRLAGGRRRARRVAQVHAAAGVGHHSSGALRLVIRVFTITQLHLLHGLREVLLILEEAPACELQGWFDTRRGAHRCLLDRPVLLQDPATLDVDHACVQLHLVT